MIKRTPGGKAITVIQHIKPMIMRVRPNPIVISLPHKEKIRPISVQTK